jgi:hypothetical protein
VRLAGQTPKEDPEVFQTIWKHLKSDGVPDQAANHMTAEMLTHGEDFESSVEKYQQYEDNYKSKGFNEHAAQAMAVEALEGRDEPPSKSLRFARMNGGESTQFQVPDGTSGADIATISEILTGNKPDSVYMNGRAIY